MILKGPFSISCSIFTVTLYYVQASGQHMFFLVYTLELYVAPCAVQNQTFIDR